LNQINEIHDVYLIKENVGSRWIFYLQRFLYDIHFYNIW